MKSRWCEHNNLPYFYCEYSNLRLESLQEEVRAVESLLADEPENSIRLLVDTQGTRITLQTFSVFKETAYATRHLFRKIAVLGANGARQTLLESICHSVGFNACPFENKIEAINWLTQDEP